MLVVLVLFILTLRIILVHSTLEELLLMGAHLRSRRQIRLSTSRRFLLLQRSISILTLLLSRRLS